MKEQIQDIFSDFYSDKTIISNETIQSGLINKTYKIDTSDGIFILQEMNQKVFPNIKALLNNKIKTTRFLSSKGFPTLEFIPTKDDDFYTKNGDAIWQLCRYIPSVVHHKMDNGGVAAQVGAYLAKFHNALLDFPVQELEYTIPDFHNTIKRFHDFEAAVKQATPERLSQSKESIEFLKYNFKNIEEVATAINTGKVPLRAVHNDTKVGNMLFDEKGNILCIIDFDTIMPGSILHDVGDALRTGTNTSTEEEKDLSKVDFNIEIYESFMKAYISEAESFMSLEEAKNIHLSLPLILFEQACRFLGDFLENDKYYFTTYQDQNLVRAKTQIKLLEKVQLYLNR